MLETKKGGLSGVLERLKAIETLHSEGWPIYDEMAERIRKRKESGDSLGYSPSAMEEKDS